MEKDKLKIGRTGENAARRYLEDKGYTIIEQNYRDRYSEIDLVVRDKETLVFVEVRTRTDERFGTPEESIKRAKIEKLIKNANSYAFRARYDGPFRIDAVCIVLDEKGEAKRIDHYENITA